MFEHQHWTQSVGLESQQGVVGIDLSGRFLRKEYSWNYQCKLQPTRAVAELLFAGRCCVRDGLFVFLVLVGM